MTVFSNLRRSIRIRNQKGRIKRKVQKTNKRQKKTPKKTPILQFIESQLKKYVTHNDVMNAKCSDENKFFAIAKLNEIHAMSRETGPISPAVIQNQQMIKSLIELPKETSAADVYVTIDEINKMQITDKEKNNVLFLMNLRNREAIGTDLYTAFDKKIKLILQGSHQVNNYKNALLENKKQISEHNLKIIKEWLMIEEINDESSDKYRILDKIKYSLLLPHTQVIATETQSMAKFFETINTEIYGLFDIKVQLMQANNNNSQVLGLAGPPGIGKTQICKSYAKACNRPITFINIGTIKDSTAFTGTYTSWLGAEPGAIVKALCTMGVANGIVVFDEIDKLDMIKNYSVYSTLLAILDPSQNKQFEDEFLAGLQIDLSKITFICTMNDHESIDHVLLDRIKIIHCNGYSQQEKIELMMNYFIKKYSTESNLIDKIAMTLETANYMVMASKRITGVEDPGVRNLIKILKSAIEWIVFVKNAKENNYDLSQITKFSHKNYPVTIENLQITKELIDAVVISLSKNNKNCDNTSHLYI